MAESNFVDYVKIYCRSGKGGRGSSHFRRAKYIPKGGPDGGNGGRGGHIYLRGNRNYWTLLHLKYDRHIMATNGESGGAKRSFGKDGQDKIIEVPCGTVVYDAETGEFICDVTEDGQKVMLLKGGKGGLGNWNFRTATNQAPRYAQPGEPAQERFVILQLKLLADVGLVGFPNAGKSTLLSVLSAAKPKIANYPFTTLEPNLGIVSYRDNRSFIMADIPGIIEGASEGVGLGFEFLRHIERTRVLVHIVDAASTEGRDPIDDIYKINKELEAYNPEIAARPQVIAANKIDCIYTEDGEESPIDKLKAEFEPKGIQVYPISAVSGQGVRELLFHVKELLDSCPQEPVVFEQEFFPEDMLIGENLPYTVEQSPEDPTIFVVEGPKIEKMLGYTNLDSEKGFAFFQKFLKEGGILEELEKAGIQEGDTVRMYGFDFDYYK